MSDSHNPLSSLLDFSGKTALVAGVLDENSIGWPIAKMLNDGGARVALSIQRTNPATLTNKMTSTATLSARQVHARVRPQPEPQRRSVSLLKYTRCLFAKLPTSQPPDGRAPGRGG